MPARQANLELLAAILLRSRDSNPPAVTLKARRSFGKATVLQSRARNRARKLETAHRDRSQMTLAATPHNSKPC
jgi:hypothetical protein